MTKTIVTLLLLRKLEITVGHLDSETLKTKWGVHNKNNHNKNNTVTELRHKLCEFLSLPHKPVICDLCLNGLGLGIRPQLA